jgi:nucleotidyltransferase AbiEii toxin of type IV toxin-antitoxin system
MSPEGAADPSLPAKVIAIHEGLAAAKIPHALGGALALAYYAEPRATVDIDLNVFVPSERWQDIMDVLRPLGVDARRVDESSLLRDGQCRVLWGSNPVDLFFAYDPFHDEMRKKARRVPFADTMVPILSPEHLTVCKAMFDRPKDWLDIEQILVATDGLDLMEIERWLESMVGEHDPRLERFEELKKTLSIS